MIRLVIFDLDRTLWDGTKLYPDVVKMLEHLRGRNVFIAMASHNTEAFEICQMLKISHYFNIVVGDAHVVRVNTNGAYLGDYIEKTSHLRKIVNWYAGLGVEFLPDEVLFVDDNKFIIQDVARQKIKTWHTPHGVTMAGLSEFIPSKNWIDWFFYAFA